MSRLKRNDDHGFLYLFAKETLFCDDALRQFSFEEFVKHTLTENKYDVIVFYDKLNGLRFATSKMRELAAKITGRNYQDEVAQKVRSGKLSRRGIFSPKNEDLSNEGVNAPIAVWDRDVLPEVRALIDYEKRPRDLEDKSVAIVLTNMSHWLDIGVDNQGTFFNEFRTRRGVDLIVLCFNGTTPAEARNQYEYSPFVRYYTEWFGGLREVEGSELPKTGNIIIIPYPDKMEIRNYLNRSRIMKKLLIPESEIETLSMEISRFCRSSNPQVSLGGLDVKIEEYFRKKPENRSINLENFREILGGGEKPVSSKQLLDEMVGMEEFKSELKNIENELKGMNALKQKQSYTSRLAKGEYLPQQINIRPHISIAGNPGTGKTSLAEIIGRYFYEIGALSSGHVIKCVGKDLIAGYVGQTAIKTAEKVQEAMGGVLFIDEISGIVGEQDATGDHRGGGGFSKEVHGVLLNAMTSYPDLSIVIAGYPQDVKAFLDSDPGYSRRFRYQMQLKDYEAKELSEIFRIMAAKRGYSLSSDLEEILDDIMDNWLQDKPYDGTWGNAGEVENLILKIIGRIPQKREERIIQISDFPAKIESNKGYSFKEYIKNSGLNKPHPMAELDKLIGLESVKKTIKEIENRIIHLNETGQSISSRLNFLFTGNPGTGKTTVARLFGKMLARIGALQYVKVIEVNASELVDRHQGEERARRVFERALGGVLFIDEAYLLSEPQYSEIVTILTAFIENNSGRLCVILAGYTQEMQGFLETNRGLRSRFTQEINFPNYNSEELVQIFSKICNQHGYQMDKEFSNHLATYCKNLHRTQASRRDFGNAREMQKLFERCQDALANRRCTIEGGQRLFIAEDILSLDERLKEKEKENSGMDKLNSLIGLSSVKEKISDLSNLICSQRKRGREASPQLNFVFSGNPGTGKTTVAQIFGEILVEAGVLMNSEVIEVTRPDLVGRYVGETEDKTKRIFEEALGKVLFIDEAYQLASQGDNDYGRIVIESLVKYSDEYRGKVCIILAGYTQDMENFLQYNPGLKSRFSTSNCIVFPDYSKEELIEIFKQFSQKGGYTYDDNFSELLEISISAIIRIADKRSFGNGREMRNLFEECEISFSNRTIKMDEVVSEFTSEDLREALNKMNVTIEEPTESIQFQSKVLPTYDELSRLSSSQENLVYDPDVAEEALVRIETSRNSFASGFLISPNGYVVTCAHCIGGCNSVKARIRIKDSRGRIHELTYDCEIAYLDEHLDIAILKIKNDSIFSYIALMPENNKIQKGESVHLFSYPFGMRFDSPQIFKGNVSSYQIVEGIETMLLGIEGKSGSSGGMCVDPKTGYVAGIFVGSFTEDNTSFVEEINYAIPTSYVWEIIKNADKYKDEQPS